MSRDFGNVESPRRVRSQHYQNRLQQLQQQQLQLQQQQQQLPWQQQQQQQLPWQQQQHPPASSRRHPVSPTGGRHQHPAYAASGSVAEVAPREDRREDLRSGQAPSPPTTDNNGLLDLVRFHPNSGELSLSLQGVPRRMRKGDRGSPRITEDLLTRTSWVDAALAHRQIKKVRLLAWLEIKTWWQGHPADTIDVNPRLVCPVLTLSLLNAWSQIKQKWVISPPPPPWTTTSIVWQFWLFNSAVWTCWRSPWTIAVICTAF